MEMKLYHCKLNAKVGDKTPYGEVLQVITNKDGIDTYYCEDVNGLVDDCIVANEDATSYQKESIKEKDFLHGARGFGVCNLGYTDLKFSVNGLINDKFFIVQDDNGASIEPKKMLIDDIDKNKTMTLQDACDELNKMEESELMKRVVLDDSKDFSKLGGLYDSNGKHNGKPYDFMVFQQEHVKHIYINFKGFQVDLKEYIDVELNLANRRTFESAALTDEENNFINLPHFLTRRISCDLEELCDYRLAAEDYHDNWAEYADSQEEARDAFLQEHEYCIFDYDIKQLVPHLLESESFYNFIDEYFGLDKINLIIHNYLNELFAKAFWDLDVVEDNQEKGGRTNEL